MEVGSLGIPGPILSGLAFAGNAAITADGAACLCPNPAQLIDLADPDDPRVLGPVGVNVNGVSVRRLDDGRLFVAGNADTDFSPPYDNPGGVVHAVSVPDLTTASLRLPDDYPLLAAEAFATRGARAWFVVSPLSADGTPGPDRVVGVEVGTDTITVVGELDHAATRILLDGDTVVTVSQDAVLVSTPDLEPLATVTW